jgi:hypothetical protein
LLFIDALMIKKLLFLALFCNCSLIYAQTIKTDVLIVGATPAGISAAIQCARSNVKATLISEDARIIAFPPSQNVTMQIDPGINSGFWGELRDSLAKYYHTPTADTMQNKPIRFEPDVAAAIIKRITDSTKNLTVYLNTEFSAIKKDGDRWAIGVTKNEKVTKILAKLVIDATSNGALTSILGMSRLNSNDSLDKIHPFLYRTTIATGIDLSVGISASKSEVWGIPMSAVIVKDTANLLSTKLLLPKEDIQFLPMQLEVGQGVGAIAAYCAFYKTTTRKMRIRAIQGELLNFKACLEPFTDVPTDDPNWRSIQQIAATGLLRGVSVGPQFLFRPDSLVSTNEVKPILIDTYTRAFLWFGKENPGEKFTLGNLLSFISDYTLTDPELLISTLQKEWRTQYHFKQNFDLKRQVTRLEFAALANKYLNPFARMIDLNGKLVN